MNQRTEEEWRRLHDNAIYAVLTGRCSNNQLSDYSIDSIVREAILVADSLVGELKRREYQHNQKEQR